MTERLSLPEDRPGLLFLCVANSARSQMAEGWARRLAPEGVEVQSAGSQPTTVNPLAVQAMAEVGIELTAHRSKAVADVDLSRVGAIVTLCADEVCPVVPGEIARHHWPLPDPAAVTGSEGERLDAFRRVRDEIERLLRAALGA